MRSSRWMFLLMLAALPLAGCSSKNKACEPCSNVNDCEAGLSCQIFTFPGGDIRNLCGDANPNMRCEIPR